MVALLLDQKTALDLEETRQATTVRLAEYVRSPGLGEDVVAAVRLGGSCQPQGLRPCHIVWRSTRREVGDEIAARPGEYLIVVAGSLEAHFRDSGEYFYRARRFGLEAQRLMRQVFNTPRIEVDVHAIGRDNVPYGARTMELTIPLLIQPRTIWTMATRLWSDRFARPGSKLFFVEPQPGLTRRPNDDLLHLLLVIEGESMEDQIPVLFGLNLVSDTTTEHSAFCPRLCRSRSMKKHFYGHLRTIDLHVSLMVSSPSIRDTGRWEMLHPLSCPRECFWWYRSIIDPDTKFCISSLTDWIVSQAVRDPATNLTT